MKTEPIYFNFPIRLIDGIFTDKIKVLNDIFDYSVYAKATTLENGSMTGKIKSAMKYFGVTGNNAGVLENGRILFDSIPTKSPKTGISVKMYFDFYKNEKAEFEIAVLCGFLAIRSILLIKPYCKVTDSYMIVRMAGRGGVAEIENLPEPLTKYLHRYHLEKIKTELKLHWNLKVYGRHTRGFYVSFDLELTDLIFEAEKKRKKYLEKNYRSDEAEARKQALRKLYEPTAIPTPTAPGISPDLILKIKQILKEKPDKAYNIEQLSNEDIEAVKYIIEKRLLPEYYILELSPDFKTLTIQKQPF